MRLVREIVSVDTIRIGEILEHKYRQVLYRVVDRVGTYVLLEPEGDDIYSGLKITKVLADDSGLRNYERVAQA